MLIPVRLLFIWHLVFITDLAISHPSKRHRRRQTDSFPGSKLVRNLIPIVPNNYEFQGLQVPQNEKVGDPKDIESQRDLMYFPRNTEDEAKNDEILASLKEVRGISDLISRDRKLVFRDQHKSSTDDVEPCGHFHKSDYNMLTDIIGKMSPEARNALIDALLKTLMDKPRVNVVKSGDARGLQHPLDAAMEPPLRVNTKPNALVQPFSLTVEREKLRDLYKYLNNHKTQQGLKKSNLTVNLGDLIQEAVKKEECQCPTTKKCNHQPTTMTCKTESAGSSPQEEEDNGEECNCDQDSDLPSNSADFAGDKVINLTQIFNVHPKLLIVNSGQFTPTDIAGILMETSNPSMTQQVPPSSRPTTNATMSTSTTGNSSLGDSQSTVQPTTSTPSRMTNKFPNSHKKCTRRFNRHGHRNRYDRRQHASPMKNLVYTYYMDMDDPLAKDD